MQLPYTGAVLTLAVDTSSESGSVAVLRDERVIGVLSTNTEETYSSRIFRQLEFLLAEFSLTLDRFDLFAVNTGPGSFTGLRVGLTMAKAWAEVNEKPIAAVGGLEAVAAQCAVDADVIVPVLNARRGQLYAGAYKHEGGCQAGAVRLTRETGDVVIAPQEFSAWIQQVAAGASVVIATPAVKWLADLLGSENESIQLPRIVQVPVVLAPTIGALGYEKFLRGETVDALHLDANYMRQSDAELNWKAK